MNSFLVKYFVKALAVFVAVTGVMMPHHVSAGEGLIKVADNVYARADVKKASPSNSFGANAGVIIGRDGIVVVDTLVSAKEAARFIKDIRAVSDKPIKYVINTHSHLDHTFGNGEFAKLGAVIVSHVNGKKNMQAAGDEALKKATAYGLTAEELEGTRITYPSITFSEKMQIDLGDQVVELIHAGPSHTDDSIMVYLPDSKIIFSGDILFTNYHPNIADGDLQGWIRTLDLISSMDVAAIIPGHGPVSGKKDVADMKNYIIVFDRKARELAASSDDVQHITAEVKKALPAREELEFLVPMNIQKRYLKK
ncbi:MAG: MBL fold metallo-hydrolase [Nitrospiraceae bacterium]|nr:MBL fold metallo-hydrolase [Nitrospiraceae bacterium]